MGYCGLKGGSARGTTYCEMIDDLYGGGDSVQVDNENQIVRARLPDCDTFFVWDTNDSYEDPADTLCCDGRTWC